MAEGFLQRMPDPDPVLRRQGDAETAIGTVVSGLQTLDPGHEDSPLGGLVTAIGGLKLTASVDVSGLSDRLPAALDVMVAALPPSTLEFVEAIEDAYGTTKTFVEESPIAREVTGGRTLQEVALAVVADLLQRFEDAMPDLAEGLIDADTLAAIRAGLAGIERFRTDFPAHRDEFLPFVAQNLLGVPPDLLAGPLAHVDGALEVYAAIDPTVLATTVGPASQALADAFTAVYSAVAGLDPASQPAYALIETRLGEFETAIGAMATALTDRYQEARTAITTFAWDALLSTHRELLEAIDPGRIETVDEVVGEIAGVFDQLRARLSLLIDDAALAERIDMLVQGLDDLIATSGVGRVREALNDALSEIRETIAAIDTEQVQEAVDGMLGRIVQELDDLHLDELVGKIGDSFADVAEAITDSFTPELLSEVKAAVDTVLKGIGDIPIAELTGLVTAVITRFGDLVTEMDGALQARMDDINELASTLDDLTFKPVSDEVIAEIEDVKAELDAIDPASLSEVERLAIRAALAVLEAIDLDGLVVSGLKEGFAAAQRAVHDGLDELTQIVERIHKHFERLDPNQILRPIDERLAEASRIADGVSAKLVIDPLRHAVDELARDLTALSPERLLTPLTGPYDQLQAAIDRLDPDAWVQPLRTLYDEIDHLIGVADIRPVLQDLETRRKALLATVRTALLDAIAALDLPEPLDGLLTELRPLLEAMTGALFDDPHGELQKIAESLPATLDLTKPLQALDAPFDQLLAMAASVPPADLTATMETLRRGIGIGLDALDPRALVERLREGEGRLAALAPTTPLGPALKLPALRASFTATAEAAPPERAGDVTRVSARFDAVLEIVDGEAADSRLGGLLTAHAALMELLRARLDALDPSAPAEEYASLRQAVDRLVPDVLRAPAPLTHAQVMDGLAAMRPSARAAPLEAAMNRFLNDLAPLEAALADGVDRLFAAIRRTLALVDPLALGDVIGVIYDDVKAKLTIIDPQSLADGAQETLDELTAPLDALDPAKIGQRLGAAYDRAVSGVTTTLKTFLDDVGKAIDVQLRAIRAEIQKAIEAIRTALRDAQAALQGVTKRFEQLVLVDLIGRLGRVLDNLGINFDKELDRVGNAFDEMLRAIPVNGGSGRAATAVGA